MTDQEERRRRRLAEYTLKTQPPPTLSKEEFLAWRAPREVAFGPECLDNQTWHWLVRTQLSAGSANERFDGPSSREVGPAWSFYRFGMSQTTLADGRVVYISGEHEDHYDADFYIYNDVIVIDPNGTIHIRGYSRAQFPATDFHSATLVENSLLIIGRLGYPAERIAGVTPVYRLSLDTWRIEPVDTDGESPGWLHRHHAVLSDDGQSVVVSGGTLWLGAGRAMNENVDSWSLNIQSGHWTRLTKLDWQQWSMHRIDRKFNRLWHLRQAFWSHDNPHTGILHDWKFDEPPDFTALAELYRIDEYAATPVEGEGSGEYSTIVDGLTVRFAEDFCAIDVVVEGRLQPERLAALQARLLEILARIEGAAWEIESGTDEPITSDTGS